MNIENKEIEIYNFEDKNIRVVGTFEEPLFAVKDICNILGIVNVTTAVRKVPDKWKGVTSVVTPHGAQEMLVVNEAGLYKLVMRSDKPVAEKFQEWVCEEVLPSIRKKGDYVLEEYKKKIEDQQKKLEDQEKQVEKLNCLLLKNKERRKHKIGNSVYIVENSLIKGIFKIGKTSDMDRRLSDYKCGSPEAYEVLYHRLTHDMNLVESIVLCILNKYRTESSYRNTKKREWIKLDPELIKKEIDIVGDFIDSRKAVHSLSDITALFPDDMLTLAEDFDAGDETDEEEIQEFHETETQPCAPTPTGEEIAPPEEVEYKKCEECKETKPLIETNFRQINQYSFRKICLKCEIAKSKRKCMVCKEIKDLVPQNFRKIAQFSFKRTCTECELKNISTHRKQHGDIKTEITDETETKVCSFCKETLSTEDFNKNKTRKGGFDYNCKNCDSKRRNATSVRFIKKPQDVPETHSFCSKCETIKLKDEFWLAPDRKSGVQCYCKTCTRKIASADRLKIRISNNMNNSLLEEQNMF